MVSVQSDAAFGRSRPNNNAVLVRRFGLLWTGRCGFRRRRRRRGLVALGAASGVDGTGRAVLRDPLFLVLLGIVGFGFVLTGLTYLTERKRTAIP